MRASTSASQAWGSISLSLAGLDQRQHGRGALAPSITPHHPSFCGPFGVGRGTLSAPVAVGLCDVADLATRIPAPFSGRYVPLLTASIIRGPGGDPFSGRLLAREEETTGASALGLWTRLRTMACGCDYGLSTVLDLGCSRGNKPGLFAVSNLTRCRRQTVVV
jgi:hypothetical protein